MKQMYIKSWSETITATHSKYVLSDRVDPGEVLLIKNCYAWQPSRTASDIVRIGIRNGGVDTYLRVRGSDAQEYGLSAVNEFLVGEGDQVFAYFPDADATNVVSLHLNGIRMSLDDWLKGAE